MAFCQAVFITYKHSMNRISLKGLFIFGLLLFICAVVKAQTVDEEQIVFSEIYATDTELGGVTIGEDCGLKNITVKFDLFKNKNQSFPKYRKDLSAILLSQGNTITLKAVKNNITRIEIEYTTSINSINNDMFSLSSGEYNLSGSTGIWSGNTRTVVFLINRNTFDNSNKCIKSIKVNYGPLKPDPDISFGLQTSFSIFENETFVLPVVDTVNGYDGELTYSSSDENVAIVGDNGDVEIVGKGTTTIMAVGTSTDTYNDGWCLIDLEVKRIPPSNVAFYESFDDCLCEGGNDGLWSGTLYHPVSVSKEGWTFKNAAPGYECLLLGTSSETGGATTPSINVDKTKQYILRFRAAAWGSGSKTAVLDMTPKSLLQKSSVELEKAKFNDYSVLLSPTTGNVKIGFSSGTRFFLDEVQLIDTSIKVGAARYTVYVAPMDIDFSKTPEVAAYKVTSVGASGITLTRVYEAPEKTPLVIEANEGTYKLEEADTEVNRITDNLLLPANGDVCGDGSTIYSLANISGVGFYKVKAGLKIPLGKAYLVISDTNAKEYMPFIGETSGVHPCSLYEKNDNVMYNIQGVRISKPVKGVYIRNGKKIIY